MRQARIFTSEEIKQIIELYRSGLSQQEVADKLQCAILNIRKILRSKNILVRAGGKCKYYDINTTFFQSINCEENAYFLGLLYADGCLSYNKKKDSEYYVSLKLKSDDQHIIEKFRDIMSPSSPIKIYRNKYSSFRIYRKQIFDQLVDLGCVPTKSLILQFPTCIPSYLITHFLRGYSDGDGSIFYTTKTNKNNITRRCYTWKITSTRQFCETMANIITTDVGISYYLKKSSVDEENTITHDLGVEGNNQVEKILDWLYKDATIYLSRKYDKYIEMKQYKAERPYKEFKRLTLSDQDKTTIIKLYIEGLSSVKIADKYNVSQTTILDILHHNNITIKSNGRNKYCNNK